MQLMSRLRTARLLSLLTATTILVPYLATGASASEAKIRTETKTVLAFPFDNATGESSDVSTSVTESVASALEASGVYRVVSFSEQLPGVDRLMRMQPEKKSMLSGPFSGDPSAIERAVQLGKELSAEFVVVGSIDKYSVTDKGVATVVATAEIADVHTGKVIKMAQASGISNAEAGASGMATVQAVRDVTHKLVTSLVGFDYQNPATAQPKNVIKKHKKNTSWIWALAIGIGIALLSNHDSDSSDSDGPPPPPTL